MAFNEITEVQKDLDIKFGATNLLNFGQNAGVDKEQMKEIQ
jgi:hypothetical protein